MLPREFLSFYSTLHLFLIIAEHYQQKCVYSSKLSHLNMALDIYSIMTK